MSNLKVENKTDRELLVEVVFVVNELKEDFRQMNTSDGFIRCMLHKQDMEHFKEDISSLRRSFSWVKKIGVALFVLVLGNEISGWFLK